MAQAAHPSLDVFILVFDMTAPSRGLDHTHLDTSMPSGGGYTINAVPIRPAQL